MTGSELRSYDLATRALVATVPIAGAASWRSRSTRRTSCSSSAARTGRSGRFDLASLDAIRDSGPAALLAEPDRASPRSTARSAACTSPDDGASWSPSPPTTGSASSTRSTGAVIGTVQLEAVGDLGPAGTAPTVVAASGAVEDPAAAATALAELIGGSAATYSSCSAARPTGWSLGGDHRRARPQKKVQKAIDDGDLAGMSIESLPQVAVADATGSS